MGETEQRPPFASKEDQLGEWNRLATEWGQLWARCWNGILRTTCPCTFDLAAIEALINFLVRRQRSFDPTSGGAGFREKMLASAIAQIERRRRVLINEKIEPWFLDPDRIWFALDSRFDERLAIAAALAAGGGEFVYAPP
jgi:hypothetical protein